MNVVITGSRGWRDQGLIDRVADRLEPGSTVIVGGAPGADRAFEEAARRCGHTVIVMAAEWAVHGRSAGFRRNAAMLDQLADLPDSERRVIAFWLADSPGTGHAVKEAMRRGYPLELHWRP